MICDCMEILLISVETGMLASKLVLIRFSMDDKFWQSLEVSLKYFIVSKASNEASNDSVDQLPYVI